MGVTSKETASHYFWGEGCDGWILNATNDLLINQERMPVKTKESRHLHNRARQFFFVLRGELTMERDGSSFRIPASSGVEIAPSVVHEARNDSDLDVHFLVISTPSTKGDRTEQDETRVGTENEAFVRPTLGAQVIMCSIS